MKSAVFTFSNLPKNLLQKEPKVKNILYQDEKAEIIEGLGVDYLINVEFTREIMLEREVALCSLLYLVWFLS